MVKVQTVKFSGLCLHSLCLHIVKGDRLLLCSLLNIVVQCITLEYASGYVLIYTCLSLCFFHVFLLMAWLFVFMR